MPKMSSIDTTINVAQDLIYALQSPADAIPSVKLVNWHKGALRTLVEIFKKTCPPAVPPWVPVRKVVQEKLKEFKQEISQIKSAPQSKPCTNEEPPRGAIVKSHP